MVQFFEPTRSATLAELADLVGGEAIRGGDRTIRAICSIEAPSSDAIGYLAKMTKAKGIEHWPDAMIVPIGKADDVPSELAVIESKNPQASFAAVGRYLYEATKAEPSIHAKAHVDPDAKLEDDVRVEAGAVVHTGVEIGRGTVVCAGAVINRDCRIGRSCTIGPNAVITASLIGNRVEVQAGAVIGEPGFGYVPGPNSIERVMQIGRVIVQDDVHIGSNVCIDRGTIGDTVIGEGTKIGNLQQIAHNVQVGRNCILIGFGGIAGSTKIGDGAMVSGGVFTVDHAEIGSGASLGGITLVNNTIPAGEAWGGVPARPIASYLRDLAELSARAKQRGKSRKN